MSHRAALAAIAISVTSAMLAAGLPASASTPSLTAPGCVLGPQAYCPGADLSNADLRGLDLSGSNFDSANLSEADAEGANLAHATGLYTQMAGISLVGVGLEEASFTSSDLSEAKAGDVHARGIDLSWSTLDRGNFSHADLSGGYFGALSARSASFAEADLHGANFTNADLFTADLSGANLTDAVLRGASLLHATVNDATNIAGADLTGATWIDGQECGEDSIGTCVLPSEPSDQAEVYVPGSATAALLIARAIAASIKGARLVAACRNNVKAGGTCFSPSDPDKGRLAAITAQLEELRKELEAHQEVVEANLNALLKALAESDLHTRFAAIRDNLDRSEIALKKYVELLNCTKAGELAVSLHQGTFTCKLTNLGGDSEETYTYTSESDIYAGMDKEINESMAFGSPGERFYYATLWTFGGEDAYDSKADGPNKIGRFGLSWLESFAGSKSGPFTDKLGFLNALRDWSFTSLQADQGGRVGGKPRYLPGTFLASMTQIVDYYVEAEGSFFPAVIAALDMNADVRGADATGHQRDMQMLERNTAEMLENLSEDGQAEQPNLALGKQFSNYSFDLQKYGINPDTTKPVDDATNPERISFVTDTEGRIYRIQRAAEGATMDVAGRESIQIPTFSQLSRISRAVIDSDTRWSTLQKLYRDALPQGGPAAWWSTFGTGYKLVQIYEGRVAYDDAHMFTVPYAGPNNHKFGDNVVYARESNVPCRVPTRMWDSRPSFNEAFDADKLRNYPPADPNRQTLVLRPRDAGKGHMSLNIEQNAVGNFNEIVSSGAVPAFDLVASVGNNSFAGTGTLFRCNGRLNGNMSRAVNADWVTITTLSPSGLFTQLMP